MYVHCNPTLVISFGVCMISVMTMKVLPPAPISTGPWKTRDTSLNENLLLNSVSLIHSFSLDPKLLLPHKNQQPQKKQTQFCIPEETTLSCLLLLLLDMSLLPMGEHSETLKEVPTLWRVQQSSNTHFRDLFANSGKLHHPWRRTIAQGRHEEHGVGIHELPTPLGYYL